MKQLFQTCNFYCSFGSAYYVQLTTCFTLKVVKKEKPDIAAVMYKIKSKVVKEAVRVYEFMKDYDKLRTGRMLRTSFPRALDLCTLGLNEAEILTLMEW